jgi:hypothetical protein
VALSIGELVAYIVGDESPLKRTLAKVRQTTTTAHVDLDVSKAQTALNDLRTKLRALARERIQIDADADKARALIAALKAELKSGTGRPAIEIEVLITEAKAKYDELRAKGRELGRDRAKVQVDITEASEKVQEIKDGLRQVDGKNANAKMDVDVGGALGKIGMVVVALGIATAAAAGLGLAVGAGAVVGAGIGVTIAGLAGIGGAVKALGDMDKGAGAAAEQSASRHLAMAGAIDRVRSAQASLANVVANAADTARRALATEAAAQRDLTGAQADLTRARADALQQLRDLAREQAAMARQQEALALAQRGSALDVRQAQEDLNKVLTDPHATELQRERAKQAFDEAVARNEDLKMQASDLATQATELAAKKIESDRKGVAGSDLVIAAQQRVADATLRVQEAVRSSAESQRQSAFAVVQAQQAIVDAQRGVQQASMSAGAVGVSAMDKLTEAMAQLSPTGQKFAVFLRGFLDGPVKELRTAAQDGLLPGVQAGLETLGPVISKNLPQIKGFASVFGQAVGGIIGFAGKLLPPFLKLGTTTLKALAPLQGVLDRFATAFGAMVDKMVADGSLQKMMGALVDLFSALLTVLPQVLPQFVNLAVTILPPLSAALVALLPALVNLLVALGPVFVQILTALVPPLKWFGDFVARHGSLVADLAVAILAMVVALKATAIVMAILDANPIILIVAAIIGLVAAFILAWRHSERFREIVVGVFATVTNAILATWNWIKKNWPYLLGMLTGPFGLAVAWIILHWDQVVGFVKAIPGRMAAAGSNMWGWVLTGLKAVGNGVMSVFEWILNRVIDGINAIINLADEAAGPAINFGQIGHVALPRFRAYGGRGEAGQPYVVGERGVPELFTPGADGYFTPLDMIGDPADKAGGSVPTTASGAPDPEAIRQAVEAGAYAGTARALREGKLRFERRGAEVLASIVESGSQSRAAVR